MTSRKQLITLQRKWFPAKTTSLRCSFATRLSATLEWRSSQRRRADSRHNDIEETNRSRRMTYTTNDLFSELNIVNMHVHPCLGLVSCDVLLPARRRLTGKRRVAIVCQPNFGWQLWKPNEYICVYFYWPPGPNPVVTIINKGWAGLEAKHLQAQCTVKSCIKAAAYVQFFNFLVQLLFKCSFYLRAAYMQNPESAKPEKEVWHMLTKSKTWHCDCSTIISNVNKHFACEKR